MLRNQLNVQEHYPQLAAAELRMDSLLEFPFAFKGQLGNWKMVGKQERLDGLWRLHLTITFQR